MKPRGLRVAVIFVCVVGLAAGLIGMAAQSKRSAGRTVYVDMDKLVTLHPAWKQLVNVRQSFAHLRPLRTNARGEAQGLLKGGRTAEPVELRAVRESLRKLLAEDAAAQIAKVESLMRAEARRKVEARSNLLWNEVASEVARRQEAMERGIAARIRSMREAWCLERVNERIRRIVICCRANVIGQEKEQVRLRTDAYEEGCRLREQERIAQEVAAVAKMRTELSIVEEGLTNGIKRELDEMEADETRRVQARASEYEQRLRRIAQETELGGLDAEEAPPVPSTAARIARPDVTGPKPTVADAMSALSARETVLARRIRGDIARALERVARERNLSLTFSKKRGDPDYTAYFRNLLAEPARLGSALTGPT